MDTINVAEKLSVFSDYWNPRIIAALNGQHVKLAKLKGTFVWHKHDNEDELFYVLDGCLIMEFRDKTTQVNKGEIIVVPRGVEHRPVAAEEVAVMLFEPMTTINTGDTTDELTRHTLEEI